MFFFDCTELFSAVVFVVVSLFFFWRDVSGSRFEFFFYFFCSLFFGFVFFAAAAELTGFGVIARVASAVVGAVSARPISDEYSIDWPTRSTEEVFVIFLFLGFFHWTLFVSFRRVSACSRPCLRFFFLVAFRPFIPRTSRRNCLVSTKKNSIKLVMKWEFLAQHEEIVVKNISLYIN